MDSLLFIACVNLDDEASGITRKVFSQFNSFNKSFRSYLIGYWGSDLKIISSNEDRIISSQGKHRRLAMMAESIKQINMLNIKYVYIRRFPCNPLVINMLRNIKRNGVEKIIWEIPTYPYDYEFGNGIKISCIRIIDKLARKSLKRYIDRIVTFSNEKIIFGIPTIHTGNGIDVDSVRERVIGNHGDSINLIAVAVLNDWHGYDRLINGLANYQGNRNVIFHLVGGGPCYDEYVNLAKKLNVCDKVIFYGPKTKSEIDDIYDICDIAVESLGWHRSQVTVGTSLKTREYVAKGMPILASTPMDIFPDGWEYAYYAPIDESPINIEKVISFYDDMVLTKDRKELARSIRQIAYSKCDMIVMMKPIVNYFMDDIK